MRFWSTNSAPQRIPSSSGTLANSDVIAEFAECGDTHFNGKANGLDVLGSRIKDQLGNLDGKPASQRQSRSLVPHQQHPIGARGPRDDGGDPIRSRRDLPNKLDSRRLPSSSPIPSEPAPSRLPLGQEGDDHELIRVPLPPKRSEEMNTPPNLPDTVTDPTTGITYKLGAILGKGGFAWCYEMQDISTGKIFAGKILKHSRLTRESDRAKVQREIDIHKDLNHKYIVRLYSSFQDKENVYIVMELCALKSLMHVCKERGRLTETEARYYLRQLLSGVDYLHKQKKILHRDLKLGNMLLSADMQVKLADFGLADYYNPQQHAYKPVFCGTPNYLSPEILGKKGHSEATDAWAIGCILYAMLVGRPPFETETVEQTYEHISRVRYNLPNHLSHDAEDMIRLLLHQQASRRLCAKDALLHPFLTQAYIPPTLSPELCRRPPNHWELKPRSYSSHHIYQVSPSPVSASKTLPRVFNVTDDCLNEKSRDARLGTKCSDTQLKPAAKSDVIISLQYNQVPKNAISNNNNCRQRLDEFGEAYSHFITPETSAHYHEDTEHFGLADNFGTAPLPYYYTSVATTCAMGSPPVNGLNHYSPPGYPLIDLTGDSNPCVSQDYTNGGLYSPTRKNLTCSRQDIVPSFSSPGMTRCGSGRSPRCSHTGGDRAGNEDVDAAKIGAIDPFPYTSLSHSNYNTANFCSSNSSSSVYSSAKSSSATLGASALGDPLHHGGLETDWCRSLLNSGSIMAATTAPVASRGPPHSYCAQPRLTLLQAAPLASPEPQPFHVPDPRDSQQHYVSDGDHNGATNYGRGVSVERNHPENGMSPVFASITDESPRNGSAYSLPSGGGTNSRSVSSERGSGSQWSIRRSLQDTYEALVLALTAQSDAAIFRRDSSSVLMISKWVDYTNRHGFGCEYSDGSCCVLFTDGEYLCMTADRRFYEFGSSASHRVARYPTDYAFSPILQNRVSTLHQFHGFMSERLSPLQNPATNAPSGHGASSWRQSHESGGSTGSQPFSDQSSVSGGAQIVYVPFIVRWVRVEDQYAVFLLSDGTIQVNSFSNHSKLIITSRNDEDSHSFWTHSVQSLNHYNGHLSSQPSSSGSSRKQSRTNSCGKNDTSWDSALFSQYMVTYITSDRKVMSYALGSLGQLGTLQPELLVLANHVRLIVERHLLPYV